MTAKKSINWLSRDDAYNCFLYYFAKNSLNLLDITSLLENEYRSFRLSQKVAREVYSIIKSKNILDSQKVPPIIGHGRPQVKYHIKKDLEKQINDELQDKINQWFEYLKKNNLQVVEYY